jgi:hypothetical protein
VTGILGDASDRVNPLINRTVLEETLARPLQSSSMLPQRVGLERVRTLSTWLKNYDVQLDF